MYNETERLVLYAFSRQFNLPGTCKGLEKRDIHSVLVKTTAIYVFLLNKLEFSNCFFTFLTLKLFLNIIKSLSVSLF